MVCISKQVSTCLSHPSASAPLPTRRVPALHRGGLTRGTRRLLLILLWVVIYSLEGRRSLPPTVACGTGISVTTALPSSCGGSSSLPVSGSGHTGTTGHGPLPSSTARLHATVHVSIMKGMSVTTGCPCCHRTWL